MQKGVSIFYEFHEQGHPHVIAGIYSPYMKTEETMRTELLSLIGQADFHERDQPTFINHTHLYAQSLLGQPMDTDLVNLFNKFFPDALNINELPISPMKFYHHDNGAYEFIWNNRYHDELHEYRLKLQKKASEKYRRKMLAKKGGRPKGSMNKEKRFTLDDTKAARFRRWAKSNPELEFDAFRMFLNSTTNADLSTVEVMAMWDRYYKYFQKIKPTSDHSKGNE